MLTSLQELLSFLQTSHKSMVAQLHQFCDINSGSTNLTGLKTMHQALHSAFMPLADEIQSIDLPLVETINMSGELTMLKCGNALYISKRPELKRRILLCGHMDTVYDSTHPFQSLTYINDNHLQGPGVADMKGGLIVMLYALLAFEKTPFASEMGWDVLINADEEIGSPASSSYMNEMKGNHQAALVYEPTMTPKGTLAKNRKGSGKLTLVATGHAAHAGRDFFQGRNAIAYLARILTNIHSLNGIRDGVTINIGKIAGGQALNIVPDKAVAKLDVRISQPEDEAWVWQQLNNIKNTLHHKDYSLAIFGDFGRPVKKVSSATERLFQRIAKLGTELGLEIEWKDSGGCCDGNNLAQMGIPVIDTLGVRGGCIHSSDEYVLIDSLVERATLSALLLVDLAQGGLEKLSTSDAQS